MTLPKHVREAMRAAALAASPYGCTVVLQAKTKHHHLEVLAPDGRHSLKTAVSCSPSDAHAHVVQVAQSVRRLCRALTGVRA